MSLAVRLAGLGARFDSAALDAYPLLPGQAAAPGWPALRSWCLADSGGLLKVAVPGAAAAQAHAAQRAAAVALHLDGSHALAACSGSAQRLALRLRVKWQDLQGAGAMAPAAAMPAHVVWDSGRARAPAALARFTPRRASFIVIDHGAAPEWLQALQVLQPRSAGFAWPLRVLWLLDAPGADGLAVADSAAARDWTLLPP